MGDCLLDILCIFIIIFLVWIANVRKENKEIIVSKRLSLTIRKNNIIIYLDNYPYKVEGENISLNDVVKIKKNVYSWTFYTHFERYRINVFTGKIRFDKLC